MKRKAKHIKRIGVMIYNAFTNIGAKLTFKASTIVRISKRGSDTLNYNTVYSSLRRLTERGILKNTGRGIFKVVDITALKMIIDHPDVCILDRVTSSPKKRKRLTYFREKLDLDSAFLEEFEIRFKLPSQDNERLRLFLSWLSEGKDPRVKYFSRRDRSKKLSFVVPAFSLVISLHGSVWLRIKDPGWMSPFFQLLKIAGFQEAETEGIMKRVKDSLKESQVSIEIPFIENAKKLPRTFEVRTGIPTKKGVKPLISRIVHSHTSAELEVRGSFGEVNTFLSALAGVQHFSYFEFLQVDRLTNIEALLRILTKGVEATISDDEKQSQELKDFLTAQKKEKEGIDYTIG